MGNGKTEVVSVRVAPRIKHALQDLAEQEMRSVANMVEVMVVEYCKARGVPVQAASVKASPRTKKKVATAS